MLFINKEDGRFYWSVFIKEKPFMGSCVSLEEVIRQVLREQKKVMPRKGLGQKKNGRWRVRTLEDGIIQDHILENIRQLATC